VWAVVRGLRLVPAVEVGRTGVDRWSGEVAPGSGTVTLGGSVAALATVSPAVRLLAQGRSTVWQRFLQDEGDQVTQRLVVSLGASVTPPAR
jgi:hypothetical protein